MRYWWVNQNQTYRHEVPGGYLWSPKRKADGTRNPFYEFMREVTPGDLVLSFSDTYIRAIGVVRSYCYECPKPAEFGSTGVYWEQIGWKVDVKFIVLNHQIRPSDHISHIKPLLPEKYSPLLETGRGSQAIYLTEVQPDLMAALANLIGQEVILLMSGNHVADEIKASHDQPALGLNDWEEHLQNELRESTIIESTEKEALILARRGQGRFRQNVSELERKCRVTQVDQPEYLRASHIKPWRDSSNLERLDGENGLLLTPSVDHLFDRGFISFEDNGVLLVSPVAHRQSLRRMGIETDQRVNVGSFTEKKKRHLEFHRNYVFLESMCLV